MNLKQKVLVIWGGVEERDISRISANDVYKACGRLGYPVAMAEITPENVYEVLQSYKDHVVLNLMHGELGEDGWIQRIFEELGVIYCGSSSVSSAITFDKSVFRKRVSVRIPEGQVMTYEEYLKYPPGKAHIVKRLSSGSSLGVHYYDADQVAPEWSGTMLVEEFIPGREGSALVYNGECLGGCVFKYPGKFRDYESKYTLAKAGYFCWLELPESVRAEICALSEMAYKECECDGMIRFDFRLSKADVPYILEANSVPAMISAEYILSNAGISFTSFIQNMINDAKPHKSQKNI